MDGRTPRQQSFSLLISVGITPWRDARTEKADLASVDAGDI